MLKKRIKTFADGTYLEYDNGKFDEWCVYITDVTGNRRPPRDADYFSGLVRLSSAHGIDKVYHDFVSIYDFVDKTVNDDDLNEITKITDNYGEDAFYADKIYTILYLAMIAEENKKYTRLGKRIKRLGVHSLLIEKKTVQFASNFMKGMGWRDIDALCTARGF